MLHGLSGTSISSTEDQGEALPETRDTGIPQEKIYGAIVDQSPVGISVRDRNGNLVLCNTSWAAIWEKSPADIRRILSRKRDTLRMDEGDSYLGDYRDRVASIYREGGDLILQPIHIESLEKWIQQRFYGIAGENGRNEYVVVLTEDVTEKKKAEAIEKALRESTFAYRRLVHNLPVAAYTTNSEGMCVSVNPAMVQIFEEESEESLRAKPAFQRYRNPADRIQFLDKLKTAGELQAYEVELVTASGRTFQAAVSATATFDEHGSIAQIDGIIRDVSTEKALEEEILKNQKLESIGLLAGGIAHDFNNIMAAVIGNISLARMYSHGMDRVLEKLENAEKASIRASELTKQLLTFARGGKPVKKPCDLREAVKEAASFAATGSPFAVRFQLAEDLKPAFADVSQIGQVISNLVLNSIQASPDGGEIEISAENTRLARGNRYSLEPDDYILIRISDDGPGIPQPLHNRIFDPYFTTKPSGSGLGLAMTYSIMRNHGGSITLESSGENGTVFSMHLPVSTDVKDSRIQSSVASMTGRGRVLVMDDEDAVREVVAEILEAHGYSTDTSPDGLSAVDMYRLALHENKPYRVVITDITVPGGMGGVEAARQILRIDPTARLIVASGYSNNEAMAHYREHGFVDSLVKPFRMDDLLRAVAGALEL